MVDTEVYLAKAIIWVLGFCVTVVILEHRIRTKKSPSVIDKTLIFLFFILVAVVLKNDKYVLGDSLLDKRSLSYNSGAIGFEHESPAAKLITEFKSYVDFLSQEKLLKSIGLDQLSPEAQVYVADHFPYLGKMSVDYPMMKDFFYKSDLPFDISGNKKNVIIFFAEGISARILQPYSDFFPGISPNINEFAKRAIKVNNYINHSFATYRGLSGQLCSVYSLSGLLENIDYKCLPHFLKDRGYETRFVFSQAASKTYLDDIFLKSGFNEIDSIESYPLEERLASHRLVDRELFEWFQSILENRADDSTPFFYGVYNYDTHHGVRLREKGSEYMVGDKNHYVLDTFHNFDKLFGAFWEYFKSSKYYENTLVVLTSDHATYPGKEFKQLIRDSRNYPGLFIDEIPLLIYHPEIKNRVEIDANYSSSINLAPTLAHLLGVENQSNHFVGTSLFDESTPLLRGFSASRDTVYTLHSANYRFFTYKKGRQANEGFENSSIQYELLKYWHSLELNNKVWKKSDY